MSLKSPNLESHAAIGGALTNSRIDHYALLGHYGNDRYLEVISRIRRGKCRRFDKKILAGRYGQGPQQALAEREEPAKSEELPPLDHKAMLEEILFNLNSASADT